MLESISTPYIIGETAFHHEGEMDFLLRLIDDIAELKLQAVKFHLLMDIESYMIAHHEAIDVLRQWLFSADEWESIVSHACNHQLDVILLCNDVASVDVAIAMGEKVKAIEIHATGLNDIFLLDRAAAFSGIVMLGVGGSSIDEVHYALNFLKGRGKTEVVLMYGFQNYPTDYRDINLSKMKKLRDLFALPVGYADHTDPEDERNEMVSCMAAVLGFNILEKHYTPVPGKKRVDHQAAVSKGQLSGIRDLMEISLAVHGDGSLDMSAAEQKYGNTGPMKKAIVASRKIPKGERLSMENLWFKRTNDQSYIRQMQFPQLLGLQAKEDIEQDEIIDFQKVEYDFQTGDFDQFFVDKTPNV